MNVYFGQIYIEPGASFPFSHHFQRRLSEEITALVAPSLQFVENYGCDFKLMFNVSAKKSIRDNEIRGPAVYKKTRSVEYTVFLPYDVIMSDSEVAQSALKYLLHGLYFVFESLNIDTAKVVERQSVLIEHICTDPQMFKDASWSVNKERGPEVEKNESLAKERRSEDKGASPN